MTIAFGALVVTALTTFGALRLSSSRGRRHAASLAAIKAFLETHPRRTNRTLSPPTEAPTEAKIFFLDAYRDRAARIARSSRHSEITARAAE